MSTIDAYETKAGMRWRVIYRRPDGAQTSRRSFTRKRHAFCRSSFPGSRSVRFSLSRLLLDAIGSNRLAIMGATGTARKPNDHELDVAKNDMKLIRNAPANKPALTHMPLRV